MATTVAFKVAGLHDTELQCISGDIEAKYSDHKNGLVLTETWATANILKSQLKLDNYLAKGPKLGLSASLAPKTGNKPSLFNTIYKQSSVHTRGFLDMFRVTIPSIM